MHKPCIFRDRDLQSRLEKIKPVPSVSGFMASKCSSVGKTGGLSATRLSTNHAGTGEKLQQVNTRNKRYM